MDPIHTILFFSFTPSDKNISCMHGTSMNQGISVLSLLTVLSQDSQKEDLLESYKHQNQSQILNQEKTEEEWDLFAAFMIETRSQLAGTVHLFFLVMQPVLMQPRSSFPLPCTK